MLDLPVSYGIENSDCDVRRIRGMQKRDGSVCSVRQGKSENFLELFCVSLEMREVVVEVHTPRVSLNMGLSSDTFDSS